MGLNRLSLSPVCKHNIQQQIRPVFALRTADESDLTFQRTSTDVVVCGVTERIVGALSGANGTQTDSLFS